MASLTVHLTVRIAWWVKPYMLAVSVFMKLVWPFLDWDDDRLGSFAERQGAFVAKHGLTLYCSGRRG